MGKGAFDKFINKSDSGAKKKEKIRQEKKKVRQEKNAWFDEQKRIAKERKLAGRNRPETDRQERGEGRRPGKAADTRQHKAGFREKAEKGSERFEKGAQSGKREVEKKQVQKKGSSRTLIKNNKANTASAPVAPDTRVKETDEMPLNKFIAWCGVCGRREAADLIKEGKVTVNGTLITQPPHRVSRTDIVKVNGKKITVQKNLVYILLNKPKDYITTTDDPEGRKTVMDLVRSATDERVFPVGRLDRNTTGVLLLTNDGEIAQRMTHPKYEVRKIYEVKVDKPVTKQQLDTIAGGVKLDDGFIQPDAVAYADAKDRSVIGIEIHSGRNRIVRRIFEKMGFKVKNLDRVMYGIFTKKNVDRGKWRFLSEKEIRLLKHLNTSFAPKKKSASDKP